jgi:hypothetical protein
MECNVEEFSASVPRSTLAEVESAGERVAAVGDFSEPTALREIGVTLIEQNPFTSGGMVLHSP